MQKGPLYKSMFLIKNVFQLTRFDGIERVKVRLVDILQGRRAMKIFCGLSMMIPLKSSDQWMDPEISRGMACFEKKAWGFGI